MAWTDPRTWAIGEAVTAALFNTHIKDNLVALKVPPTAHHELNQSANLTTTQTAFVDVDSGADATDEFTLTITTSGGDVMIGFVGSIANGTIATATYLDVYESVGAARLGGDDGLLIIGQPVAATIQNASFVYLATGLAAGAHTFTLQWKISAGTATMYAGAGGAGADNHPQFWVREVS